MYHGVSVLELNLYNFVSLDLFHLFTVETVTCQNNPLA